MLSLTLMILSCSPAVKGSSDPVQKNVLQKSKLKVLSATESTWIGGVAGVHGKIYTIKIKRAAATNFNFTTLKIGETEFPVKVAFKNNIYTITARTSPANPQIDAGAAPGSFGTHAVNSEAVLYYMEAKSKSVKQLVISDFIRTGADLKAGDELIP